MKNKSVSEMWIKFFRRKNVIFLEFWRDIIVVDPQRKKKSNSIFQYNICKGLDRVDGLVVWFSLPKKVAKESCILAYKWCIFNLFQIIKNYTINQKEIYRISDSSGQKLDYWRDEDKHRRKHPTMMSYISAERKKK